MRTTCITMLFLLAAMQLNAQKKVQYSVKSGDTYARIAAKYGIDESALRAANADCPDILFPGLIVDIPARQKSTNRLMQDTVAKVMHDRIKLKDSTYIECKIINTTKTVLRFRQDNQFALFQIAIKDIYEIRYADGSIKRYDKTKKKGGRR